jgi:hypothetical protein
MLMLGNCLPRWQLALVAGGCTFLAEWLGPGEWMPQAGIPRDLLSSRRIGGRALRL